MMSEEAYPMPSHVRLLVADVPRAVTFYEALGFTCVNRDAVFVHLRWAKYADVFLVATPSGVSFSGQRGLGVILGFLAGDVPLEVIAERAAKSGAPVDGPRDMPWFTRELLVTDPEGYRLLFVVPNDPALA